MDGKRSTRSKALQECCSSRSPVKPKDDVGDIRTAVRSYYAKVATERGGKSPSSHLKVLPSAVLSCGCGNPLGIVEGALGFKILDLGCGAGADLSLASAKVGPSGLVVGLDMTREMLAKARALVKQQGLENVALMCADITLVPFRKSLFDLVTSNCVINLSASKARVFKELGRVVRKGGRVVISDIVAERGVPSAIRSNPTLWSRCISGAVTAPAYLRAVRNGGFSKPRAVAETEWDRVQGVRFYSVTVQATRA